MSTAHETLRSMTLRKLVHTSSLMGWSPLFTETTFFRSLQQCRGSQLSRRRTSSSMRMQTPPSRGLLPTGGATGLCLLPCKMAARFGLMGRRPYGCSRSTRLPRRNYPPGTTFCTPSTPGCNRHVGPHVQPSPLGMVALHFVSSGHAVPSSLGGCRG